MHSRPLRALRVALVVVASTTACSGVAADQDISGSRSSTVTAAASTAPADIGRLEASVRTAVASYAGRGDAAMVAVVRVGDETRVVTAGFTDLAHTSPVEATDRFRLASITKSMTATAVLQYVASGRISLDDPIDRWLPGLLPFPGITARHLLSHRSGLYEPEDKDFATIRTDQDVVKVARSHPLDFAPGADGKYSNAGYTVLGLLVEKLSGRPLSEALRRAVFEPAGMTAATLGGRPSTVPLSGGQLVEDEGPPEAMRGAGEVVASALDVDRFYRRLFTGALLPPTLVNAMGAPTGTSPFAQGGYGLGLWIWPLSCGEGLGHSGAYRGYATKAWTLRGTERSVVVLVADGQAHSFADNVAEAALCP